MTTKFLITTIAAFLAAATPAGSADQPDAGRAAIDGPTLRLISVQRGNQASLVPYKFRIRLEDNDRDISLSRLVVSWPSGRGDITAINGNASNTWAADPDVDAASNPPIGSSPGTDLETAGNVRRALSAIDFFATTTFSNGDTIEFEFTAQGSEPFLILLKPSGTDTLVGQNPPTTIAVEAIKGIPFLPGSDPFQRVLSKLLGQPDATQVQFLDPSADAIIDSADLNAFAGI